MDTTHKVGADTPCKYTEKMTLSNGEEVEVRSLEFDPFAKIVAKIESLELPTFPGAWLAVEWLANKLAEGGESEKLNEIIAENRERWQRVIVRWLVAQMEIIPVVLEGVTDLGSEGVKKLRIHDAIAILTVAWTLIDLELLLELLAGFFVDLTGRMPALSAKIQQLAPAVGGSGTEAA